MSMIRETTAGRVLIGRIAHDADLLDGLTQAANTHGIQLARVEAIGAVQTARLAFYDQRAREYYYFDVPGEREIASLVGNISLKDGAPILHAHITLCDGTGAAVGGHLAKGTIVFACEFTMQELSGATLARGFDETTGLPLWEM